MRVAERAHVASTGRSSCPFVEIPAQVLPNRGLHNRGISKEDFFCYQWAFSSCNPALLQPSKDLGVHVLTNSLKSLYIFKNLYFTKVSIIATLFFQSSHFFISCSPSFLLNVPMCFPQIPNNAYKVLNIWEDN